MDSKKEVSVIIPTYNEEKDICECLKSLLKQSYKILEVIIVDDGSTDKTIKRIREFLKKYKLNLKIIKQNHRGPGKARNLGTENARGKILIVIDADMTFDRNYIKNLIKPILKDKTGKVMGTTHDNEIAANTNNIVSILWGKTRVSRETARDVPIFRAIRKDKFIELGKFDPKYGYADDQTFWFKYRIKPTVAKNTICYHKNPSTLKETYKQARWIGASWKERFFIFRVPVISHFSVLIFFLLLPLVILIKSLKVKIGSRFFIIEIIKYYSVKFYGYSRGIFRAVYLNKVWR